MTRKFLLLVGFVLAMVIVSGAPYQIASADSPEEGEAEFSKRCVSCHTIGGGVKVGPDLKGVAERRDLSWLKQQILEPSKHDPNDPDVVTNRKIYGIQMPDLRLDEQQVDNLIAYLETDPTLATVIPAQYAPTLLASVLGIIGLTVLGLRLGTKKVEVRPREE